MNDDRFVFSNISNHCSLFTVFNCCCCFINNDQLEIDQIIVAEIEFVSNRLSPPMENYLRKCIKKKQHKTIYPLAIFMESNLNWFVGKRDGSQYLSNINLNGFFSLSFSLTHKEIYSSLLSKYCLHQITKYLYYCFRNALRNKD